MSSAIAHALGTVSASIPSPTVSYIQLGPLQIHFYALFIMTGIVIAAFMTNSRLTRRGAEPWVVIDISLLAVPIALVGARIFHVATHLDFYFGEGKNPWNPLQYGSVWAIWEGGIAIFGALLGGAVGAWLGCKWTGIRFWTFADALAPGILLAQAIGRLGNWFNNELFGLPTTLPWGLEISSDNPAFPTGLPEGTLFHPTFLYEMIWNVLGVFVILWLSHRFTIQWGKLFAVYLMWYGAGRIVWESIRIDPSEIFFGIRTNVWAAIFAVVVGFAIYVIQSRRHPGLEPSPYMPGRARKDVSADVESQNDSSDFVDVSPPPAAEPAIGSSATSA